MKRNLITIACSLAIVLLSIPAIAYLLPPGYYRNHDGEGHIIRLQEFHLAVSEGNFPPRISRNLMWGYGYYFFNFNYPLVYWLGEAAHVVGFDFTDSIKVVSILGILLSGVTMFLWQRYYWGVGGAMVAAVFYMYAPYRLLTLYVRAALAEHLAFIMLPLLFLFTEKIAEGKVGHRLRYVLAGGAAYALLMLSHNITAFIFSIMMGFFMLFHLVLYKHRVELAVFYATMVGLGLGLSAYFWVPAIAEKEFVRLDQTIGQDFPDHFVYLQQLVVPSWGFGGSGVGLGDGLSFQVGVLHLLALVLAIPAMIYLWRLMHHKALHVAAYLGLFLLSVFMMIPLSRPIWDNMPLIAFTQFPWRFLSWSIFITSILAGTVVFALGQAINKERRYLYLGITGAVIVLAIAAYGGYAVGNERADIVAPGDRPIDGSTTWADEQFPKWFEPKPNEVPAERVEIVEGEGSVEIESWKSPIHKYTVTAKTPVTIVEHTAFYPGWEMSANGDDLSFSYTSEERPGMMLAKLDVGKHEVVSRFGETPLRRAGDGVTIASLGLMAIGLSLEAVWGEKWKKI